MDSLSVQPRAAKKRRASQEPLEDLPLAEPVVERSSTFWLDDGNVILQTSTMKLRVHKSVLKMHSIVFEDMFTLAEPDDQPSIDECPIVAVTDTGDDWEALLVLLYHTEPMYVHETHVVPTSCLLPMLRLGHKYGFERFKTEALQQLYCMYPRTLQGLDEILDMQAPGGDTNLWQLQTADFRDQFKILKAATELGIETVLPTLYFRCVRDRSLAEIFEGRDTYNEDDDTIYLSKEMQVALAIGKEAICRRYPTVTFSWWHEGKVSSSCTSPASCTKRINATLRRLLKDSEHMIESALQPREAESSLCPECGKQASIAHTAGRQVIFDGLPAFFGLPPWGQLKDF